MIIPCGLSIIKEEWKSGRVGEGKRGRGEEWGWEKSPFFLLPDIRYTIRCRTSFFLLPDIRYRIRCRTSFLIKWKQTSAIAKPKPKLQPNCEQPQSSPLRY